jgi:hypothetical protein
LYITTILTQEHVTFLISVSKEYVVIQYQVRHLHFKEVVDVVMFIGSAALQPWPTNLHD